MKIKKFNNGGDMGEFLQQGGAGADIITGSVQAIYGARQLKKANQEFERAKAAAPSLETPSQYYENYKNAYDSELARMEQDAIQSNLATSIQALQGAGGRALVGGLSNTVAQQQAAQNRMLAQERTARLRAGSELARAEERAVGRKYKENIRQQDMAMASAQAARQNVASGLTNVATGVMFGGLGQIGAGLKKGLGAAKTAAGEFRLMYLTPNGVGSDPNVAQDNMTQFANNFRQNYMLGDMNMTNNAQGIAREARAGILGSVQRPEFNLTKPTVDLNAVQAVRDQEYSEFAGSADYKGNTRMSPNYSLFSDRIDNAEFVGAADQINISQLPEQEGKSYSFVGGNVYQQDDSKLRTFEKGVAKQAGMVRNSYIDSNPLLSWMGTAYDAVDNWLDEASRIEQERQATLRRYGNFQHGGMMTPGEFSHKTNPIDLVQDGVKVGEATGNEYIINKEQAIQIANESSFAQKLFKRFEKNAKKNK